MPVLELGGERRYGARMVEAMRPTALNVVGGEVKRMRSLTARRGSDRVSDLLLRFFNRERLSP